jgi:polysaccharide export outer membrane protein
MKKIFRFGIIAVCVFLASVSIAHSQEEKNLIGSEQAQVEVLVPGDSYIIGPEDVLSIDVWREPTLSKTIPVRMDGKISLPLIDEIQATGLTPLQLKEDLSKRFREYLDDPVVSVVVTQINSYKVYVTGEVRKPGVYRLGSKTTILQIISLVEGFTEWANTQKIILIRKENGQDRRMTINYKKIIHGDFSSNILLMPGDTIIVP